MSSISRGPTYLVWRSPQLSNGARSLTNWVPYIIYCFLGICMFQSSRIYLSLLLSVAFPPFPSSFRIFCTPLQSIWCYSSFRLYVAWNSHCTKTPSKSLRYCCVSSTTFQRLWEFCWKHTILFLFTAFFLLLRLDDYSIGLPYWIHALNKREKWRPLGETLRTNKHLVFPLVNWRYA